MNPGIRIDPARTRDLVEEVREEQASIA